MLKIVSCAFPFYVRSTLTNRIRLFKAREVNCFYFSGSTFPERYSKVKCYIVCDILAMQKLASFSYTNNQPKFPIFILDVQFLISCVIKRKCVCVCVCVREHA